MNTPVVKIYCVGGAVRDQLLGFPVKDRDWVVVGADPDYMLQQGFSPVGKDFPVFLHPQNHEEYALARTERKTARGYKGFEVSSNKDVTLEQDLLRRDFTINAIAQTETGQLIDPYNGQADLKAKILRHVSPAFSEDPVRILRGARFAARYGFSIAPETMQLMSEMVQNGEVDALVKERVWQELAKSLMEAQPSLFFTTLKQCNALAKIFPEIDALFGVPQPPQYHPEIDCGIHSLLTLDRAAVYGFDLATRFAALTHDLGKANSPSELLPRHTGHELRGIPLLQTLITRQHLPNDVADLALLSCRYHGEIHRAFQFDAEQIIRLLQETDAFRRPNRFQQLLNVCICDAQGRTGHEHDYYPQANYLSTLLNEANSIQAGQIAAHCTNKKNIPEAIFQARVTAIQTTVQQHNIDLPEH